MADVASLGFQVDSGPVRRATGDLEGLRNSADRVAAGTSQMSAAVQQMIARFSALATGAGSTILILYKMRDAAMALADRAGNIKDFGETTGFTVMQLQALEKAGAQVGVSGERVNRSLERFSVAMDDVKKGTGAAFEGILEINPALAKQFTQVNDLSDAWDLFSKAIKAADLEQANKLARAVFGREGVPITRLLRASADAGGIAGLVRDLEKVGYITAEQADKWDTLGDNINEAMKTARQNITATFTGATLQVMNSLATGFRDFSVTARNFTMGDDFKKFLEWSKSPAGMAILAGGSGAALGGMVAGVPGALVGGLTLGGVGLAKGLQYQNDQRASLEVPRVNITGGTPSAAANAAVAAAKALEDQKRALSASIAEQERYNAVAGAAVTPAENLRLGMDKLKLAFLEGKVSAEQMGKAQGGLNAQFNSQQFAAYIGLLGQSASVAEQVRMKEIQIADARRAGIVLTKEQADTQLRLAREQALGTTQIIASTDALKVEADTIFMSTGAAVAHSAAWNAINQAKRDGKVLTQDNIAEIWREADALGAAAQRVDGLRAVQNEFRSSFVSFGQYMRQGESAWGAFKHAGMDALGRISDKLMSMAADNLFNAAFGGGKSTGGGLFGLLGGLFSGGAGGPMSLGGPAGPTPLFASGGYTGRGGVYEPKGIVHGGEYVFSQASVNRLGVGNLDRLHRSSLRGYAEGGYVGFRPANTNTAGPAVVMQDNRTINIGQGASAETVQALREELALDRRERAAQTEAIVRKAQRERRL